MGDLDHFDSKLKRSLHLTWRYLGMNKGIVRLPYVVTPTDRTEYQSDVRQRTHTMYRSADRHYRPRTT
jgi:hypothetical protein